MFELPPKVAETSMKSTRSPLMINGFACASVRSIVVVAEIRHVPADSVMLAVATDAAWVPDNGELWTITGAPFSGTTFTDTIVLVGMLFAVSATVTGLVCAVGTVISGSALNEPTGMVGTLIPATDVIFNCGGLGGIAAVGVEVVNFAAE